MRGRIRLYDYRCFQRESPATLEIRPGLTSLIGQNNSGKSSLIKSIYEIRPLLHNISAWDSGHVNPMAAAGWSPPKPMQDHAEIVSERLLPQCRIEIEVETNKIDQIKKIVLFFSEKGGVCTPEFILPEGEEFLKFGKYGPGHPPSITTKKNALYNLEAICEFSRKLSKSIYLGPFRNAINEGANEYFDCSVGTQFIEQWQEWKVGGIKEKTRLIQKATEDIRELIGAKSLEINASGDRKTLQIAIDGRSHMLPEIGAGISQMIILIANALIKKPSFILIDDPELNLHPSLQFSFITKLAKYSSDGLIYTTHSMGLARLADYCYTVQRKNDRSVVRAYEKTSNLTEFLGSLGIASLLELGWKRILLVEGPTDVRVAQQILKLYEKDSHTVVLPLGGDGMINGKIHHELSEIRRLCPTDSFCIAAIVDSERESMNSEPIKARRDFSKICDEIGIICHLTERRATENYVSQSAIDLTWPNHSFHQLTHYEKTKNDNTFWGKSETWRAIGNMTREDFNNTDLGVFFNSI